jgi:hypothetical protein
MSSGQQNLQVVVATALIGLSTLLVYYWRNQEEDIWYIPEHCSAKAALIAKSWSPGHRSRRANKFLGLKGGPLRGGDFVLTAEGSGATCSFCFSVGIERYGVTVGHLAPVGDPIFVFTGEGNNEVRLAGYVVSVSSSTDSLVFSISKDIPATDQVLAKKSVLEDRALALPTPNAHLLHPERTALFGYGAMRKGAVGLVTTPAQEQLCGFCLVGSVGISSPNGASLTDKGDCGAIFIDEEGVYGPTMHYLCWTRDNVIAESFGIPLASIIANHTLLGGCCDATVPCIMQEQEQQAEFGHQSHDLAHFDISIKGEFEGQSLDIAPPTKLSFK